MIGAPPPSIVPPHIVAPPLTVHEYKLAKMKRDSQSDAIKASSEILAGGHPGLRKPLSGSITP